MDVAHGHDGDAGHGHDELAVFLDALDVAFGALVDAVDHAHAVARAIFRRVGAEILDVPAGVGRGHQDEGAHLIVADGPGFAALRFCVEHKVLVVFVLELDEPFPGAADKEQRGDQLLLDIGQAAAFVLLDGMHRDIGLGALCFEQGLEIDHAVPEHLQGVPVKAVGGWIDKVERHVRGYYSYSPALRRRSARTGRIWREGPARQPYSYPRACAANPFIHRPLQDGILSYKYTD